MKETVKISLYKGQNICVETENYHYLNDLYKHFEFYVKNYNFIPAYQSGKWNGKKGFFRKSSRSLPYGLLTRLIKFTQSEYKNHINIELDEDVKNTFTGEKNPKPKWDLLYKPHYYQEEVILTALKMSKGIFKMPTASGKSLMITYIIKHLLENNKTKKCLIIVPTISLVRQFKDDMIDYGIEYNKIGMVNKDYKEWDNKIVISTWQSLSNYENEIKNFDCVIVDEVHGVRGDILHNILKKSSAFWRFGFTGTMPDDILENIQVQSYIGPVLKSKKSNILAEQGYIAKCNVKIVNVQYSDDIEGTFSDVKNEVFAKEYRLNILKQIIKNVNGSILLLVDKVEKEGDILEEFLKAQPEFKNKEIFFISGKINDKERAYWQKKTHNNDNIILIATFGVFQMGINIKSLKYCVLCSSFKSSIRILQSIGRTLRKHISKDGTGSCIFDINDDVKYLDKHGNERRKFYTNEEFNVDEITIEESRPCLNFKDII